MTTDLAWFAPKWELPEGVSALVTTSGVLSSGAGAGAGPFGAFNLATHVGDDPAVVHLNRQHLVKNQTGLDRCVWLNQVHGTAVVDTDVLDEGSVPEADAVFSRQRGLGCAVLTADCLPVLFCHEDGNQVAAAHAGWRGLLDGVLENTVAQFADSPERVLAYLGPAISQMNFEVGPEVKAAFEAKAVGGLAETSGCFIPSPYRDGHFLANLYALARLRLRAAGLTRVSGGGFCTYLDSRRFYSYRRSAVTGRMASLIWLSSRVDKPSAHPPC